MSDTPETDECIGDNPHDNAVELLCKDMERQRDLARVALREAIDSLEFFSSNQTLENILNRWRKAAGIADAK